MLTDTATVHRTRHSVYERQDVMAEGIDLSRDVCAVGRGPIDQEGMEVAIEIPRPTRIDTLGAARVYHFAAHRGE